MSTASSSSLFRWRPAILALTVLSAGLTFYHIQRGTILLSDEPQPQLHRSNAIHRRSRQHGRSRSSTVPGDTVVKISAQQLTRMFHEGPDTFGYNEHSVQHPAHQSRILVSRSNLRTLADTLQMLSEEEADGVRQMFEETLVMTFLCARMPVNSVLKDPGGRKAFISAFENEGFDCLAIVSRVLTAWNLGKLDQDPERLSFYERNQIPTSTTRSFLEEPPEGSEIDLFTDETNPHATRERLIDQILSSDVDEEEDEEDESETSWRPDDEDGLTDEGKKEGQTLLNMLYHIAEDQSRQNGYIHRGVSCNSCGMLPIRGIRYRCSNCPDYDLCEQCEAMQVHPKTHLLYKIRVPAPFFDNSHRPQAPRYPGKLSGLPNHLPLQVSKQLSHQSGRELPEVEALWDTFKCLATVEWPSDPLGFGVAIDRDCFDLCFLASTSNSRKPPNLPMHDRIFAFFDSNEDNLIGFGEFVTGVATIRTKDRKLRLKRTFWVYDFDEDGYVSRNDFLFMFRSYYALSKDLTLDIIQNMEYDVLEGPNPQDIILGTQPISAAYNGAIPRPPSRKRGEGKTLDLQGERVIIDGKGVITERDSDLADYWDVIGEASEKAACGNVIDLDAWAPFVEGSGAAPAGEDHPLLLNKDWPPLFITPEDAARTIGIHIEPGQITSLADRRKCVIGAIERRLEIRRLGVQRRRERNQFYESQPLLLKENEVREDSNPTNQRSDALNVSGSSLNEYPNTLSKRVPPPVEDDVGQEYLFQMLQEGLNELLDPLFKQREELAIEARKTRDTRDKIRDKLDAFGTPNMRKLCNHQVNNFEILPKTCYGKGAVGLECNMGQELRKIISLQEDESSDEFVKNLKSMVNMGVIDQDEFKQRMKDAKVTIPPAEDDNETQEKQVSPDAVENGGSPSRSARDVTSPFEELDRLINEIDSLPPLRPVHSSTAGWQEIVRGEQSNTDIVAQADPGMINAGPAQTTIITAITEPATSSGNTGSTEAVIEEYGARIDEYLAAQPLEDLLTQAGYTAMPPSYPDCRETPPLRDPMLPQNRPNSEAEIKDPPLWLTDSLTLVEEYSEREPTQQELKYHLMLECLEEEDAQRGGSGRLNPQEFETIMNGPMGARLSFTSMFFEMVNF